MPMTFHQSLQALLACPACRQSLTAYPTQQKAEWLVCQHCQLKYPVMEGIPVLIVEQATRVGPS